MSGSGTSSGAKRRARIREKGKKNVLSNCTLEVLLSAVKQVFPDAKFRSSVLWASTSKGKFSIWLPKGEKISKSQSKDLQGAACAVINSGGSVNQDLLQSLDLWDSEATVTELQQVAGVFVIKYQMKFVKPGEEEGEVQNESEWIFDISVGEVGAANVAKEAVKKGGASVHEESSPADSKNNKNNKNSKKTKAKSNAVAKKTSSKISEVQDLINKISSVLPGAQTEDLEPLLRMFYNNAYTQGFVAGTTPLSPSVALLDNRL